MYSADGGLGIIGIPSIVDIARGAAGAFASSGGRDPSRLCPGSPPIVLPLAAVFAIQPGLASEIQNDLILRFAGEKDLAVVQRALDDPGALAQAAVWLAWGGADCKTGSKEPALQRRLQEIARSAPALTPPCGGLPFSPTVAGIIPAGGGANTALLVGAAVLAGVLLSGRRRRTRR